jgi:hypothetical protein
VLQQEGMVPQVNDDPEVEPDPPNNNDGSSDSSLLGNVGSMKIDGKYFPSDILFLFLNFVCEKFLDFQKKFKELYYSSDPFMQEM